MGIKLDLAQTERAVVVCLHLETAAQALAASLVPLAVAVRNFGCELYALAWYSYIKAGAPYGETRKGLTRWINEQQDVE